MTSRKPRQTRPVERSRKFPAFSRSTALLVVIVATTSIIAATLVSMLLDRYTRAHVPSFGTLRTIGVEAYWDAGLQNRTEAIQWGVLLPGSSQNATLYLRSISNVKTSLQPPTTTSWTPEGVSQYMDLSWDYNGTELNPGDVVKVTLTLSASRSNPFIVYLVTNDVTQFSFEIIISSAD